MGDETAISLRHVGKCYKRYPRPVDRLKEILLPGKSRLEEFWALRDIDLEVPKGQTLGIIGRNGSGKSTMLQIIAGTLQPTTGEVKVNGRVSALLELGSGFNPEFTGRQNVFFNGRLLGLSQQEIEEKFDDVAGFADIGDFIDQPVKTYSSGMFVRLAFAVAVNVNPEILIVDEALSVGDGVFVHRCMSKIKDFQDYGGTLLFVSHDTGAVTRLCSNALWLNDGKIIESGNPYEINKHYQAWTYAQINDYQKSQGISSSLNETNGKVLEQDQKTLIRENLNPYTQKPFKSFKKVERFGTGAAEIIDFKVVDSNNESAEYVYPGNWIKMIVKVLTHAQIESPIVGIMLYDRLRMPVTGFNTSQYRHKLVSVSANQILNIEFELEWPEIQGGNYALEPAIANGSQENHEMIDWLQFPLNIVSGATELTFGLIRLQNIKITHNLIGYNPTLKPILAEVEINSKSHLL